MICQHPERCYQVSKLTVSEFESFRSKKKPQIPQVTLIYSNFYLFIFEIICEIGEICGCFSPINALRLKKWRTGKSMAHLRFAKLCS
jgi:hypothetical protein